MQEDLFKNRRPFENRLVSVLQRCFAWLKGESGAIDSLVPDVTGTNLETLHANRLLLHSRVKREKLT